MTDYSLSQIAENGGRLDLTAHLPCQWFARCTHEATKTRPHPILGFVPICERCDQKMEEI